MKRLKDGYILIFFKLWHVHLGCHIDSLANEWYYTVGDNNPVPAGSESLPACSKPLPALLCAMGHHHHQKHGKLIFLSQ